MPSYVAARTSDIGLQALLETRSSAFGTARAEYPLLMRLRQIVPFEHFAISGLNYEGFGIGKGVFLASNLPVEAIEAYLERRLIERDPVARRLSPDHPVTSCHDLSAEELSSPEGVEIYGFCKLYGIAQRTSFALCHDNRMYGAATFTRQTPFSEDERLILLAFARQAHDQLSNEQLSAMNLHLGLTQGERVSLQAICDGLSVEEAADRLGYTPETVQSYLKTLMRKLGANNRAHVVAEAFRRHLVR